MTVAVRLPRRRLEGPTSSLATGLPRLTDTLQPPVAPRAGWPGRPLGDTRPAQIPIAARLRPLPRGLGVRLPGSLSSMSKTPHREWLEVGFSAVILLTTFYIAPAMGVELPYKATGVAILAAMALFGDGAGDLLRNFTTAVDSGDEPPDNDSSGRV